MFGGFKSIERDFIQKLKEREDLRKVASEDVMKPVEEVSAEDFLISSDADDTENVNSVLDKKIEDMSNEADDIKPCVNCSPSKPCASCGQLEHSADCHENKADDDIDDPEFYSEVNDMMDTKVSFVLNGLGKIAADLRSKNERFAADMVEATAIKIKNEELEKVANKLYVFSELRKISSELLEAGDDFAADMVEVTMNKLRKKSSTQEKMDYNSLKIMQDNADKAHSAIHKFLYDNLAPASLGLNSEELKTIKDALNTIVKKTTPRNIAEELNDEDELDFGLSKEDLEDDWDDEEDDFYAEREALLHKLRS